MNKSDVNVSKAIATVIVVSALAMTALAIWGLVVLRPAAIAEKKAVKTDIKTDLAGMHTSRREISAGCQWFGRKGWMMLVVCPPLFSLSTPMAQRIQTPGIQRS